MPYIWFPKVKKNMQLRQCHGFHICTFSFWLTNSFTCIVIQGDFFNWHPPKSSKCQPVPVNSDTFWWDLLCNLTLRTFWAEPVKKPTLYILVFLYFFCLFQSCIFSRWMMNSFSSLVPHSSSSEPALIWFGKSYLNVCSERKYWFHNVFCSGNISLS